MLSSYDPATDVLPSMTNDHVCYGILPSGVHTGLAVNTLPSKRSEVVPQFDPASSFLLTTPTIMTVRSASVDVANISSARIAYGETPLTRKRISFREARQLALRASQLTQDGLRADREQEARILASAADADEDA